MAIPLWGDADNGAECRENRDGCRPGGGRSRAARGRRSAPPRRPRRSRARSRPSAPRPRRSAAPSTRTATRPAGTSSTARRPATGRRRRTRTPGRERTTRRHGQHHGPRSGHHLPLPARRLSSSGTTKGADGIFDHGCGARGRDRRGDERHAPRRTLNGSVNPNGRADRLLVRVRQDGELRLEDAGDLRRRRDRARRRSPPRSPGCRPARPTTSGSTRRATRAPRSASTSRSRAAGTGPSAKTKPATSVTSTSARLNGRVNPNGQTTT